MIREFLKLAAGVFVCFAVMAGIAGLARGINGANVQLYFVCTSEDEAMDLYAIAVADPTADGYEIEAEDFSSCTFLNNGNYYHGIIVDVLAEFHSERGTLKLVAVVDGANPKNRLVYYSTIGEFQTDQES